MSLCDDSEELLESYGISFGTNDSNVNSTITTQDPVFKHWCSYGPVPAIVHYIVGTILILICVMSITGNLLVIVVFSRYRRLRSPANTLIVNLAVSDMLNGFLHPMAAYSSFQEHWMFHRAGCELYAGLCGLFGLVSIVTLTAIAIERCLVISVKPWYGGVLFTQAKAKTSCVLIWVYCFAIVLPPFFGWGSFVPEGFLTSCSFDYISQSHSNRSYFFYIFIVGFFFPVTIIVVCYVFIMRTIYQNEKDMKKNNIKKVYAKPKKRNDFKAAEMIMFVIAMFLVSWTPYSVIAMIGQFGNKKVLTPWVSVLPSIFAKMSTIYNPAIYGLSHRHFRATLRRLFKTNQRNFSDRGGTYFSRNSSIAKARNGCPCFPNYGASDIAEESSSSFTGKNVYVGVTMPNTLESKKIIYVKKASSVNESCQCEIGYEIDQNENSTVKVKNDDKSFNESFSKKRSSISIGSQRRPVILSMHYDAAKLSLIKSLMFKSESSIHQKYQTFFEEGHIIRIPSSICFYGNDANPSRKTAIVLHKSQLLGCLPTQYIQVLNMGDIQVQKLNTNLVRLPYEWIP